MEKMKGILLLIIIVLLVGFTGYWALATIESGSEHISKEKLRALEEENEQLKEEMEDLERELEDLTPVPEAPTPEAGVPTSPSESVGKEPAPAAAYKYQSLISKLEKLIDDNIV